MNTLCWKNPDIRNYLGFFSARTLWINSGTVREYSADCVGSVSPQQWFWPQVKTRGITYRCHACAWNCRTIEPDEFGL